MIAIVAFVVAIIAAIMFHEWGHFVTARRFGMRADRFFLGFGPTLWSTTRGETTYGVKALPLGGFVRIRGMLPDEERLPPVPDTVLDPERVAEDRRAVAEDTGRNVLEVPAIPERTWGRLREVLEDRGTPPDVAERIVGRMGRNISDDATPQQARGILVEILATETTDTGRVGDLHHRLLKGDEGRFFPDRPAWQRAVVLAAGSVSHFVLAAVALFAGFLFIAQPVNVPVVSEVQEDSPAAAAGLERGDRIVSISDTTSSDFEALRTAIQERAGEPTRVVLERDGRQLTLTITPEPSVSPVTGERVGVLGFVPRREERRLTFGEAAYETFAGDVSVTALTTQTVAAMGRVFGPEGIASIFSQVSGEEERDAAGAMSLVGAAQLAGEGTASIGLMFFIFLLAAVNIFVGIFNILPLPPLDGGHLAVLGVERGVNAVRRLRDRPADFTVDPRTVAAIALPVIVFFGILMVALVWLDIANPMTLG